jgi:hypothetical protein
MRARLHSVLTLLLACLMLGAGTQSAICELACNLGGDMQCHGATAVSGRSSSEATAMAGMPQMHCSGMKSLRASNASIATLQIESGESGQCRYPSPIAAVSSSSANESVAAVHWVVLAHVPMQAPVTSVRLSANSSAPSCLRPVDPLLVTLRV